MDVMMSKESVRKRLESEQGMKKYPNESENLPELRISTDTSRFPYKNKQGHRSAIRISRIVSETLKLGMEKSSTIKSSAPTVEEQEVVDLVEDWEVELSVNWEEELRVDMAEEQEHEVVVDLVEGAVDV
ncbi:unnamed protein product [Fraxinus pennsylvanica]|uniref:Uncharacterized protein n=1 Tax=Fraxinus pennsylvanica TaxID=56036 RepID=A0AAD1ZYW5_9LAMI|nr:unnamed protein product [Fraxinus pennsylvanica]